MTRLMCLEWLNLLYTDFRKDDYNYTNSTFNYLVNINRVEASPVITATPEAVQLLCTGHA